MAASSRTERQRDASYSAQEEKKPFLKLFERRNTIAFLKSVWTICMLEKEMMLTMLYLPATRHRRGKAFRFGRFGNKRRKLSIWRVEHPREREIQFSWDIGYRPRGFYTLNSYASRIPSSNGPEWTRVCADKNRSSTLYLAKEKYVWCIYCCNAILFWCCIRARKL